MKTHDILLRWYRLYGRFLPWRNTRDPYKVLVSEIMLQQTQVPRVLFFYPRWMKRFPNWKVLARATNVQVVKAWAGLGYNRRALILRDIARAVVKNGIPDSENAWKNLKGIGNYTAAALTVFSQHQRTFPIDTNTRRVVGRLLLGKTYPQPSEDKRIKRAAMNKLMQSKTFYDIPQALFDIATSYCTKIPDCASCPLRRDCKAAPKFLSGHVNAPKRMIKKASERIHRDKRYPDRIYRGRIVQLVREHPQGLSLRGLGKKINPTFDNQLDREWLEAMISRLLDDKLIRRKTNRLFL